LFPAFVLSSTSFRQLADSSTVEVLLNYGPRMQKVGKKLKPLSFKITKCPLRFRRQQNYGLCS